ncbi:hypothetical protein FRB94_000076 [Tulasnella sp. JGI-2019a]|nr:hypothetical protein FRB94_000076 [Tulasnella sp. JGI-2019a]KAG9015761.1 hypothetical protein FRB93_012326 [Tulasnella sp. JGI-2019a]KAG9039608.1 hypothetical protein FRB95_009188 [Tulasnella sp. JGI-2019a]
MAETLPIPATQASRPTSEFSIIPDRSEIFRLGANQQTYAHQYSSIYFLRLTELRKTIEGVAGSKWGNLARKPDYVKRVLDVTKGQLAYVIGTVYMEMPLKPSILEDIAKDEWTLAPPPKPRYYSDEDRIMLEDESGRVKLVGDVISKAQLVTGVIISALGMETASGDFEVLDWCCAGLAEQSALKHRANGMEVDGAGLSSTASGEWIALVSGLDIGLPGPSAAEQDATDMSLQLLVEYLASEAGGVEDQSSSSEISRLVIVGNSVVPVISAEEEDTKSKRFNASKTKYDPAPLNDLTALLTDISRAVPIHIVPGLTDPTGTTLPQQPLPRAMFGKELYKKPDTVFACETNPAWIGVGDCEMLAIAGQTIDDLFKYVEGCDRMEMAKNTLKWRHMAPTAPDTLWCYPFLHRDPFMLEKTPHIYVIGNQPEFASEILTNEEGDRRTRIILLPRFSQSGCLVLVNTETLEIKTVSFKVSGM